MLEQNIKRLEEISKKLENGTNIDESLKLYEEGCKLAKTCLKELEKAKGAVKFCLEHESGSVDFHGLAYWAGVVERLRKEIKEMI